MILKKKDDEKRRLHICFSEFDIEKHPSDADALIKATHVRIRIQGHVTTPERHECN